MTLSVDDAQLSEPVAPVRKLSPWQRIVGVLFSPIETMRDIAATPDLVVPLLVMFLVSILSSAVMANRVDFAAAARAQAEQNKDLTEGQREQAARLGESIGRVMVWFGPFLSLLILVLMAGVLLLSFRAFGGEGDFLQALSITTYAWYPMLIKGVLMLVVLLVRDNIDATQLPNLVMSNLGVLVDMTEHPILYTLLTALDLFTLWTLALLAIGFAFASRLTQSNSTLIVIFLWGITLVVRLGFAALGAMASGRNASA